MKHFMFLQPTPVSLNYSNNISQVINQKQLKMFQSAVLTNNFHVLQSFKDVRCYCWLLFQ